MSIDIPECQTSPASTPATEVANISKAKETASATQESKEDKSTSTSSTYSPAHLLSSLLSPFSFSGTSSEPNATSPKEKKNEPTKISIESPGSESTTPSIPEPYYTPEETPLFKALAKTRLTRTRTKQLVRAGERGYNDPPPPSGLGDCCGSSCDPCVRDLWKQEIGVWRERWGDRGVEDGDGEKKGEGKSEEKEEKVGKRKDLDW